jgi:amidase
MDRSKDPYYQKTSAMTSLASIGRMPEITIPIGNIKGVPHGLSFLGRRGRDSHLLSFIEELSKPDIMAI